MSELPLQALRILHHVLGEDAELHIVGGALRDLLLQRPVGDIDLATALMPEEVLERGKRGHLRAIPTGLKHGTVTLIAEGHSFEITTFRSDGDYLDGRRPEQVKLGVALEEDLARRDFTINAMALSLASLLQGRREITDPFEGRKDLEAGILRAVGDPLKRFEEDGLRPLRACRFASQLDFELEPATQAAISQRLEVSRKVAVERVFVELTKLLCGAQPAKGLRLLEATGLLDLWLPEVRALVGCVQNRHHRFDVWEHTLATFDVEKTREPAMRWGLLLHDLGKPETRTVDHQQQAHFYGHEEVSARMAEAVMHRLRASKALRERVVSLVRLHGRYPEEGWSDATYRRLLKALDEAEISPEAWELFRLADQWGKGWASLERLPDDHAQAGISGQVWWNQKRDYWRQACERLASVRAPGMTVKELALDGHALMQLAQRPSGRWLGELQKHLLEHVMEEPAHNTPEALREAALAWLSADPR